MKYFGLNQLILAVAIFAIVLEAAPAKLQKVNPNKKRGAVRGRKVVKRLRNGRQGRQIFGSRVPILPATPILPPAPLPAAPIFGPQPAPLVQPLQLIEVQPAAIPRALPLPAPQPVVRVDVAEPASLYKAAPAAVAVPEPAPVPAPVSPIIEVKSAPTPSLYTVPKTAASERVAVVAAQPPVAITRSVYNAPGSQPGNDAWNYEFEADNGIKQSAVGEMKDIGDSLVMVMKGSYEYIGVDGLTYVVDWEADELGFRASAPHLPKSVPIPFPEQQAAVDAQIRFAAEEERLRAAGSAPVPAYGAPEPVPAVVEVRAPVAEYGLPTYAGY